MTGYTLVTRDSEFDDADRRRMLGYRRYLSEVCACGWHSSITDDPSNILEPVIGRCPVCAGSAKIMRLLLAKDEAARKDLPHKDGKVDPDADDPADGRTVGMRLLPPGEAAKRRT